MEQIWMVKEIPVTRGMVALVDDEDYERLASVKWHAVSAGSPGKFYARRTVGPKGAKKTLSMHQVIAQTQKGMHTDHINNNGLDNRRSNLRVCTPSQNHMNKKAQSNSKTGCPGVCFQKREQKYRARIKVGGVEKHIGLYADLDDAKSAYRAEALKWFGEFAHTSLRDQGNGGVAR